MKSKIPEKKCKVGMKKMALGKSIEVGEQPNAGGDFDRMTCVLAYFLAGSPQSGGQL